jgi:hypothetical protein
LQLGMTFKSFQETVPHDAYSSTPDSDGLFVVFSPAGVETSNLKTGEPIYMLEFSKSMRLTRIQRTNTP